MDTTGNAPEESLDLHEPALAREPPRVRGLAVGTVLIRCRPRDFDATDGERLRPRSRHTVGLILGEEHAPIVRMNRGLQAWLLVVALTLSSTIARAEEPPASPARAEARALGYAGVGAYAEGDFVLASERLERAYSLLPASSLGLWSARALVRLGKLVQAQERYLTVTRMQLEKNAADVHRAARATAELELRELLPKLPSLSLSIAGAPPNEVIVTIDGNLWPLSSTRASRWINPGRHQIVGAWKGQRSELELVATEGASSEVFLRFESPAAASASRPLYVAPTETSSGPSGWSVAGWTLVGLGGASLVVSAVSYAVGKTKYDELHDNGTCRGDRCRPGEALQAYGRIRQAQTLSLVLGLVLGAAGCTALALDWGASEDPQTAGRAELLVGIGSVAIRGQY